MRRSGFFASSLQLLYKERAQPVSHVILIYNTSTRSFEYTYSYMVYIYAIKTALQRPQVFLIELTEISNKRIRYLVEIRSPRSTIKIWTSTSDRNTSKTSNLMDKRSKQKFQTVQKIMIIMTIRENNLRMVVIHITYAYHLV